MKQYLLLSLIIPLFAGINMDAITRAISAGDVATLGQYLDETVEIAVMDNEDLYDKSQALPVLKGFFGKYQPKSFSQVHQGTSKGSDSVYCIGNLVTSQGAFRVYIYMRVEGSKYWIQELRFDKE